MNGSAIGEFKKFCKNGVSLGSGSWGYFESAFEIEPKEFLSFAEKDLASDCDHKLVNALSNTKRAIQCQIDSILMAFHLNERAQKERWNFPTRVQILNRIGIISPRVLGKINNRRNLLEHEYEMPDMNDVEDALDIAVLFIEYTNRFLENLPNDIHLVQCTDYHCDSIDEGDEDDDEEEDADMDSIEVIFNQPTGVVIVGKWNTDSSETSMVIPYDSEDYLEFLKMMLEISKD